MEKRGGHENKDALSVSRYWKRENSFPLMVWPLADGPHIQEYVGSKNCPWWVGGEGLHKVSA